MVLAVARDGECTLSKLGRWRGLVSLVGDAVAHGSRAVERVQLETAARPFWVLERIPPLALPSKVVHVAHDVGVKVTHGMIRGISTVVVKTADAVLAAADDDTPAEPADAPEDAARGADEPNS